MSRNAVGAAIVAAALTSCSSGQESAATSNYASVISFQSAQQNWLVADRPEKGLLTVQHDTFGAAQRSKIPQRTFEQAAADFLAKAGRACRTTTGAEVMLQTWEFSYRCETGVVAKPRR